MMKAGADAMVYKWREEDKKVVQENACSRNDSKYVLDLRLVSVDRLVE